MKIFAKAKPSATKELMEKISKSSYSVSVKEPPKGGAANRAIARALAEYFGVAPSRVRLVSGFSARKKVFEVF